MGNNAASICNGIKTVIKPMDGNTKTRVLPMSGHPDIMMRAVERVAYFFLHVRSNPWSTPLVFFVCRGLHVCSHSSRLRHSLIPVRVYGESTTGRLSSLSLSNSLSLPLRKKRLRWIRRMHGSQDTSGKPEQQVPWLTEEVPSCVLGKEDSFGQGEQPHGRRGASFRKTRLNFWF